MKKAILFIIFTLFMVNGFCQSLQDLDNKGGFKEIKLGDLYSKWSAFLTPMTDKGDYNGELYNLNHSCCDYVFSYKIGSLILEFINNKIIKIYIALPACGHDGDWKECYDKYNDLVDKFKSLYGKQTSFVPNNNNGNFQTTWRGVTVQLTCDLVGDDPVGQKIIYMTLTDIQSASSLINNDIKKGF